MNFKKLLFCIGFALTVNADTIISFQPNTIARASEVNSNFSLIMKKLDSLKTMATQLQTAESKITMLEKKCDSIIVSQKSEISSINDKILTGNNDIKMTKDSLTVSDKRNYLPTGTIIASWNKPDANGFMTYPDGTVDTKWQLAAGQRDTIPDLRGVFIRGINPSVPGGRDTTQSDVLDRKAGSYQEDSYKAHNHNVSGYGLMRKNHDNNTGTANAVDKINEEPDIISAAMDMSSSGGTETRPKNVALYYYIKIK